MKNRQSIRASRAGQALWMIISLLTLFVFVGTLVLVYLNMQYFHDEGMWPEDKTNFFMKSGDESFTPPPRKPVEPPALPTANDQPGAAVLPGTDNTDSNATSTAEDLLPTP